MVRRSEGVARNWIRYVKEIETVRTIECKYLKKASREMLNKNA